MAVILLIRHGENDYVKKRMLAGRLPGVHLNQNGIQQANLLAEKLKGAPVKAVYSSPLDRTMETAEPIAKALSLEVIPEEGLNEVDSGDWQGQKLGQLRRSKEWKVVQGAPSRFRFPEGEYFSEAQLRIANTLQKISSQHSPKNLIICVSHSDPIRLAIAYFIGLPLDFFQRLQVSPASITTLMIGERGSSLLSMNNEISFIPPNR
jgi:probable phosphomutase (TIGR03848 family)